MSARKLRPRATSALVVSPVTITDRTSAMVLGLEPRAFRDLVAQHNIAHVRIGQRIIVRVDDVLAVFDRIATTAPSGTDAAPEHERHDDHDQPRDADEVLRRVGLHLEHGASQ